MAMAGPDTVPDRLNLLPDPINRLAKPAASHDPERHAGFARFHVPPRATPRQRIALGNPVPRVGLCVLNETGGPMASVYRPMACLVLQGAKEVMIGNSQLRYDAASCFIASVDVAATGRVTEATPERPYVVTSLSLDHQALAGLLAELPASSPIRLRSMRSGCPQQASDWRR
jgi:hypothetical protein